MKEICKVNIQGKTIWAVWGIANWKVKSIHRMTNFWRYLMSIWKLTIKTVFKSSCLNSITIQIQITANWKEKHTYQHLILLFQRIIITIQICLKLNKVKTLRKTICPTDTWNRWLLKSIQKMVPSKKTMQIVDCRK